MQHVELVRALSHLFEHQHVVSERVADLRIETEASLAACDEFRRSLRVAAGE
jgi:hypothetical protein